MLDFSEKPNKVNFVDWSKLNNNSYIFNNDKIIVLKEERFSAYLILRYLSKILGVIKIMSTKKRLLKVLLVIGIFIIQQLASKFAGFIANLFNYNTIDKDAVFAWISVHHIIQLLVALILIVVLSKKLKLDFNFRIGNIKTGKKYFYIFSLIILIYVLINYIVGYYFNQITPYNYQLNSNNIIGSLCFQLLLSGTSEEILFRALPIPLLLFIFGSNKKIVIKDWSIPLEIIISSLFFSIAHISWSLNPFIINADLFQLVYAFVLSIAYGYAYIRSQSIVYPILMHSISNVLMVGIGYIFAVL